jgi:hypothetical protein
MNFLLAIAAGLGGGAVSAVVGFVVTLLLCQALHVSDREGAVGYTAVFAGLVTGAGGMILSIALTLRRRRQSPTSVLVHTPLALAGIAAMAAAAGAVYYFSGEHPIVNNGPAPVLDLELQAPPDTALPDPKAVQATLQAGKTRADVVWNEGQMEEVNGRPVLRGHLDLYLRTSDRLLAVGVPGDVSHLFRLKLPARPLGGKCRRWSDWHNTDWIFTAGSREGQRVPARQAWRIRYLVQSTAQ